MIKFSGLKEAQQWVSENAQGWTSVLVLNKTGMDYHSWTIYPRFANCNTNRSNRW